MLNRALLGIALLATAFVVAAPAHATGTITVTLGVDYGNPLPDPVHAAACTLTVADGANGGDVLDAAVAAGCIRGWTPQSFAGFGRLVQCIDSVAGNQCENDAATTFWLFSVNGAPTDCGIDGYHAAAGDSIDFAYTSWVPSLGTSLLPLPSYHCA
ncbi:MAG: DUF4430 domain-containing protein [Thermoplasmatota archaeon]